MTRWIGFNQREVTLNQTWGNENVTHSIGNENVGWTMVLEFKGMILRLFHSVWNQRCITFVDNAFLYFHFYENRLTWATVCPGKWGLNANLRGKARTSRWRMSQHWGTLLVLILSTLCCVWQEFYLGRTTPMRTASTPVESIPFLLKFSLFLCTTDVVAWKLTINTHVTKHTCDLGHLITKFSKIL